MADHLKLLTTEGIDSVPSRTDPYRLKASDVVIVRHQKDGRYLYRAKMKIVKEGRQATITADYWDSLHISVSQDGHNRHMIMLRVLAEAKKKLLTVEEKLDGR